MLKNKNYFCEFDKIGDKGAIKLMFYQTWSSNIGKKEKYAFILLFWLQKNICI